MSDSGDYESEHFDSDGVNSRSSSGSPESRNRSQSRSRSHSRDPSPDHRRTTSPPPAPYQSSISTRSTRHQASSVSSSSHYRSRSRSSRPHTIDDDGAYYDGANDSPHLANENHDLRSGHVALSAAGVPKLKPTDVATLKGLSGDAWNKKLAELVSTVKGEAYSRAPAHASLLIDSTGVSALGGSALVNHLDPSTHGSSSGSMFSANPPPYTSAAKRQQQEELASNERLFAIARVSDGVVYGAKAYANKKEKVVQQKDKVLDKFAMDAEEMRHTISQLKKECHQLKQEMESVRRESELLDAHLESQNRALDDAALKKGFLRVGPIDKPRYEKVVANSSNPTTKLSLEEEYLTLQIQNKSLRQQKLKLEKKYDDLQDELGSLSANYVEAREFEKSTKDRILSEVHTLQDEMIAAKQSHEADQHRHDQRIETLRREATHLQSMLEVHRKSLTTSTLAYQEQLDLRTAMQAKITAIRNRIARHKQ